MKLLHVVGARPNFIKVAPVWRALARRANFAQCLLHTGQHYDVNMSDIFFTDLELPAPDHYLGVGSGSHATQTAAVMVAIEEVLADVRPDWLILYGDVNSTLAAALVGAKLGIAIAHVEAGLRSFDRTMPEELNRIVTDQLAHCLLTPSSDADENLNREGIAPERIHRVGNVMIDTLVQLLPAAQRSTILPDLALEPGGYAVLTLHRPANVDDPQVLRSLIDALLQLALRLPIIFPVHPRTRQHLTSLGYDAAAMSDLCLIEPVGYLDFLCLQSRARLVFTDSGGIQEETSYLGIPCLTLRPNTERPITLALGTNALVGHDTGLLLAKARAILQGTEPWDHRPPGGIPLWDGHASERIADVLSDI